MNPDELDGIEAVIYASAFVRHCPALADMHGRVAAAHPRIIRECREAAEAAVLWYRESRKTP